MIALGTLSPSTFDACDAESQKSLLASALVRYGFPDPEDDSQLLMLAAVVAVNHLDTAESRQNLQRLEDVLIRLEYPAKPHASWSEENVKTAANKYMRSAAEISAINTRPVNCELLPLFRYGTPYLSIKR